METLTRTYSYSFSLRLEPLERRILLAADFGDAPAFYPTLIAENGAQHEAVGPTLGAARDSEADGAHSAAADADGADDDGVTFGTMQVGQVDATLLVMVQGGSARLDAWIDFNGDGNWGGPGEQIADSLPMVVGDNVLSFDVPSTAASGVTFARFRLSTAGDLGLGGPAADGEVEDDALTIDPPGPGTGAFDLANTIGSTGGSGASGLRTADVDGDGDQDVVAGRTSAISWHENDGSQNFTPHEIITAPPGDISSINSADVDGDGDLDLLYTLINSDQVAWLENDGAQNFTSHLIASVDAASNVSTADIDCDGDVDVLATFTGNIAWYENDGNQNFALHAIPLGSPSAVSAADMDGDGDLDLLSSSDATDAVVWFDNDGAQNFTQRTVGTTIDAPSRAVAADMDGDGDLDIVSLAARQLSATPPTWSTELAWFENDGAENFTKHVIATQPPPINSMFVADINGDGALDILFGARAEHRVGWFENDGAANFAPHTISLADTRAQIVTAADMDADGDLDVLWISNQTGRIAWHEQSTLDGLLDYGDAPEFYRTRFEQDGARHVPTGPTLGATRDSEYDQDQSPNADADGADEDGVTFGTVQVGATGATVTVNVQGGPAKLDAWIDFDGDGNWGGVGEQVADSVPAAVGDNVISFDVPSWAASGTTFARFRLSTTGELGLKGLAADGEVEDHALAIVPPAAEDGAFIPHKIDSLRSVLGVHAADLDGDGDNDFVAGSRYDHQLFWYENDGLGSFTRHLIEQGSLYYYPTNAAAADMDHDGDMDLVVGTLVFAIFWYENDGDENFTRHTIRENPPNDGRFDVEVRVVDLDGDGDLDVISQGDGLPVEWHENGGAENFTTHFVGYAGGLNFGGLFAKYSLFAADVDHDGDLDLAAGALGNDGAPWFENDGSQNFTRRHFPWFATALSPADIDGDGDIDVFYAHGDFGWLENLGFKDNFSQQYIVHGLGSVGRVWEIFAADIDGDGDMDAALNNQIGGLVSWYENDGAGEFTLHTITAGLDVPMGIFVADMDGDHDLDVLAASNLSDGIYWYENVPRVPSAIAARQLFYNQSAFDGADAAINADDDGAIAPDKTAYLPGDGVATFANVSSYSRGINGIMLDLTPGTAVHAAITRNDFAFKVGTGNSPDSWTLAPAPTAVSVRTGAGASGSDRVEITWASGAIKNAWLEVQVLANDNTGLAEPDVFYFGNRIGDTGAPSEHFFTTTVGNDVARISAGAGGASGITDVRDIDRSNTITLAEDRAAALANIGVLNRLNVGGVVFADSPATDAGPDIAPGPVHYDRGIASALATSNATAQAGPTAAAGAPTARRVARVDAKAAPAVNDLALLAADGPIVRGVGGEASDDSDDLRIDEDLLGTLAAGLLLRL
ncbi:MAG: FG-GAP repeat domain-containing protein [Pirellulales bacterium]